MAGSARKTNFYEPEPRRRACGTNVGNRFFTYRGRLQSFKLLNTFPRLPHVEIFNTAESAQWTQRTTTGTNPPGLWGIACTAIGHLLYTYGGWTGSGFSGALNELDASTLNWRELTPLNPSEGPMRKASCGMISINDKTLCIVAGYGIPNATIQPGSQFVKDSRYTDGRGYTNELHTYNLEEGNF